MSGAVMEPVVHAAAPVTYASAPVSYAAAPVSYATAPAVTYAAAPTAFTAVAAPVTYASAPVTYASAPVTYAAAPAASVVVHPTVTGASGVFTAPAAGHVSSTSMVMAAPSHTSAPGYSYNGVTYGTWQEVLDIIQGNGNVPVVKAAWDNHFEAFGSQNVQQILQDYSEASVITVYNQVDGTQTVYNGIAGATECFTGLFSNLSDTSDLAAPVQVVKEATGEEPGSVFLIWSCGASGFAEATDTFIFDRAGKIVRQNVVITYTDPKQETPATVEKASEAPTGAGFVHNAWANHFGAFGSQNVEQILLDYVEESVISVYNFVDGTQQDYTGLSGAKECFTGLFASLSDCSDLAAPIQHVEEPTPGGAAQVFLVWSCGASGYTTATDSFIFNNAGKILRQHVVVHFESPKATKKRDVNKKPKKKGCC